MTELAASDLLVQVVEYLDDTGQTKANLHLTNDGEVPLGHNWRLYFSMGLTPESGENRVAVTLIDGRYGYLSPPEGFEPLAPGACLVIPIRNWLFTGMPLRARQGFHVTFADASGAESEPAAPRILPPVLVPLDKVPNAWIPELSPAADISPQTAEHLFDKHVQLGSSVDAPSTPIPEPRHSIESGRSIQVTGLCCVDEVVPESMQQLLADDGLPVMASINSDLAAEEFHLDTGEEQVTIEGGSSAAIAYGFLLLGQVMVPQGKGYRLPVATYDDKPDFEHRAVFLDIARHFQPLDELKKIIQAMSAYRLNRLQLGICNDEGWRLELPGLPELTDVGARRGFHATQEGIVRGLYPAWGDDHQEHVAFLTAGEFVDLLKYAADHHVEIVPEINGPGHANALIRAMQASGRYAIVDPLDRSVHRSAQGYSNNVVDVSLAGTYQLMGDIFRRFIALYEEAGVSLNHIHLGGDEVPEGAWLDSPACRSANFWDSAWDTSNKEDREAANRACTKHYIDRILEQLWLIAPGVRTGFWHEMSPFLPDDPRIYVNGWTTETGDRALIEDLLERGQHLVISNASYLYLDMPYGLHQDEPGLPWAAYIDTDTIYQFDPMASWGIPPSAMPQIEGLQAQLWTETIVSPELLHYHLFPRLMALAERAWNRTANPSGWPGFATAVGKRELPRLDQLGIAFRLPPPGVCRQAGYINANVMFPGLEIRYTTDGSDPTQQSQGLESRLPIDDLPDGTREIRLACFLGARSSRVVNLQL